MTRIVVSDTSPLRALAHLQRLDWLAQLFESVYIPPGVANELEFPPSPLFSVNCRDYAFLLVRQPANVARVAEFRQLLDLGEAEALALAEELGAHHVLMDEAAGRRIAAEAGFRVLGTLGIILEAKSRGWCAEIAPYLDRLEVELRFFIAPELRQTILQQACESSGA
jgi:predicted nucleic acid-binding protein